MQTINLDEKFQRITAFWSPKIIAELNDSHVKLARLKGEFVWHKQDDTDDCFLVLSGQITIQLRDRDVHLGTGELFIVPRGVEHRPVAPEELHILLIERTGTPNNGDPATAAQELLEPLWSR